VLFGETSPVKELTASQSELLRFASWLLLCDDDDDGLVFCCLSFAIT